MSRAGMSRAGASGRWAATSARTRLDAAWSWAVGQLDAVTSPAREREAVALLGLAPSRRRDRLVADAYFALAAPTWGGYASDPDHLTVLRAGLATCQPPRTVLDLGTGAGAGAVAAALAFPAASVVGVDRSGRMLRQARARGRAACAEVQWRRGDLGALPVDTGWADLVLLMNAVPDPAELRRVCRPAGQVLAVSNVAPVNPPDGPWARRLAEHGLRRQAAEPVGTGHWERLGLSPGG